MKKIIMSLVCLIGVNSGAWSQAPDLVRTPEAKKLVDEYINAGGKNIQDINDMLEEPYGDYTPMQRLGEKKDTLSLPLIVYTLRKYDDTTVKKDCIDALVKLKDNRAVPVLRDHLDYKDWKVRLSAAIALLKFNKEDAQAIKALRNILLSCPVPFTRGSSTRALMDFDPMGRQYLLKATVEDKDWGVRFSAIESLLIVRRADSTHSDIILRNDLVIRDIALVLLVNWLKTAPVTEWQYAGDAIRLLQDFSDYFAGSEWVMRELQQMPKDFKTGSYDLLMEKIKAKSSGQ